MRFLEDYGSGTVLGLGMVFAFSAIIAVCSGFEAQSLAIARLQAITDSAALAAEDRFLGLAVGFPCESADQIVKEFGATLEECHKVGSDIYIGVSQQVMGIVHRVHARAGSSIVPAR